MTEKTFHIDMGNGLQLRVVAEYEQEAAGQPGGFWARDWSLVVDGEEREPVDMVQAILEREIDRDNSPLCAAVRETLERMTMEAQS